MSNTHRPLIPGVNPNRPIHTDLKTYADTGQATFSECITGCGRQWGFGYCGELCEVCAREEADSISTGESYL